MDTQYIYIYLYTVCPLSLLNICLLSRSVQWTYREFLSLKMDMTSWTYSTYFIGTTEGPGRGARKNIISNNVHRINPLTYGRFYQPITQSALRGNKN